MHDDSSSQICWLIQLGTGGVGHELAQQMRTQQAALQALYGVALRYLALADRSGALTATGGLSDETLAAALEHKHNGQSLAQAGPVVADWEALLPAQPCIVVDVTAAGEMEAPLGRAVRAGHRVVLANKRPLTDALPDCLALLAGGATRYEATVGAGLPVLSTLRGLLDSGDQVTRIEASMSGTLAYLCAALEDGTPLSQAVETARSRGWTEPDPRDDLSGMDVARKALILARTCGLPWGLSDVPAEPWFPPELASGSVDDFLARLPELDAPIAARVDEARRQGHVLRYVATIAPAEQPAASIALRALPADHPLASLRGTDNLFAFTTTRYATQPLVVRGPGAGVEVTAAGVLADIVATARELRTG